MEKQKLFLVNIRMDDRKYFVVAEDVQKAYNTVYNYLHYRMEGSKQLEKVEVIATQNWGDSTSEYTMEKFPFLLVDEGTAKDKKELLND